MKLEARCIAALLCLAALPALGQRRPLAPVIPAEALAQERSALAQAEVLLARGEFGKAQALLTPLATSPEVRVGLIWGAVPRQTRPAWRQAAARAVATWNAALNGAPRFRRSDGEGDGEVVFLFETQVTRARAAASSGDLPKGSLGIDSGLRAAEPRFTCMDARLTEQQSNVRPDRKRTAAIRISINLPGSDAPHSARSIEHLVACGLGAYLGLEPTDSGGDAMGLDTHDDRTGLQPSQQQVETVLWLRKVRAELLDDASRRIAVRIPYPVIVLTKRTVDLGDVWQGDPVKFALPVRNDGEAPLTIQTASNCGCTATTSLTLAPGMSTKIDGQIRTDGLSGPIAKTIDVATNDPTRPHIAIELKGVVRPLIEFLPSDRPVIALNDDGPTVRELTVVIHDQGAITLRQASASVPYAAVSTQPVAGAANTHKLTLTVQSQAPLGRSVFRIMLATSSMRAPQGLLTVTCEKGIGAIPVSVYLGAIGPSTKLPLTQLVTLSKRGGLFRVLRIDTGDPNLTAREEPAEGGRQHRVTLTYRGGWPAGSVQRKLVVETDDPRQPRIEVPVVANVVPKAGGGR